MPLLRGAFPPTTVLGWHESPAGIASIRRPGRIGGADRANWLGWTAVGSFDRRPQHLSWRHPFGIPKSCKGPDTIQPGLFFGKGFGDLPDSLSWLRPFGVTGIIVDELPFGSVGTTIVPDPLTGKFQTLPVPKVETLHWGFTVQYSTYYFTDRFTGGPPKDEPLNQLVPLVEFNFDSPRGQKTAATMNPGFAYVAVRWQIAAEAIVPLNREAGSGPGFRAQLLFFLDDLIPSVFGKPLLSEQPNRGLTAWH